MPTPDQTHHDAKDTSIWPMFMPEHPVWRAPMPDWQVFAHQEHIVIESPPLFSIEHISTNALEWLLTLNLMRPCVQGERIAVAPNGLLKLQWGFTENAFHHDRWQHLNLIYQLYETGELGSLEMDRRPSSEGGFQVGKELLMRLWETLQSGSSNPYPLILDDEELAIVIEASQHQPLFILPNIAFNTWELLQPIDLEMHQNLLTAKYAEIILQAGSLPAQQINTRLGIDPEYNVLMVRRGIESQTTDDEAIWAEIKDFLSTVSVLAKTLSPMLQRSPREAMAQKWL